MPACHNNVCQSADNPYADRELWYDTGGCIDSTLPDVFYIPPTCLRDWTDSLGTIHHYADQSDPKQKKRMKLNMDIGHDIFGQNVNFFSPYYKQVTMETWAMPDDSISKRFQLTQKDILDAFSYYINNMNKGRRFILAGFSQGGKCVVSILKNIDEATAGRMVAAYVCGFKVTETELREHANVIKPAQSATDNGTTIILNSVTDTSAICNAILGNNAFTINPASWTCDTMWHRLNDSIDIKLEPGKNTLLIRGIDTRNYYQEKYGILFKEGCLHLYELDIYRDALRQNMEARLGR